MEMYDSSRRRTGGSYSLVLLVLFLMTLPFAPQGRGQDSGQDATKPSAAPSASETQKKNLDAYIALMRRNVRQDKAEIMGSVMALSAADAAKFWPIYEEYDLELNKLNDQRAANVKQYALDYTKMTDEEANELIQKSLTYQQARGDLLTTTYKKMKDALGALVAARFIQVEHQLLLLVDLQIASSLPIVGS